MRRLLLLAVGAFVCTLSFSQFKYVPKDLTDAPAWAQLMYSEDANLYEVEMLRHEYYLENTYEKNIHERNFLHWKMANQHLVDENGNIDKNRTFPTRSSCRGLETSWYPIGPFETHNLYAEGGFPVSWQSNVFCMDVCISNPDVLIAGIEGGDLFKSEDKGLNWFPITEGINMRTPSACAIAPSDENRIYVVGSSQLYKSSNGGESWELMMSVPGSAYEIIIHPENPDIVFICTNSGLQKSTDGGEIFTYVLEDKTWDAKFHPNDFNIVYALQHSATNERCEFFKSIDGGDNFTLENEGWYEPENINEAEDIGGKIGLSSAAPDQIYVALIGQSKEGDNGWIGLYKSTDAGDSWTLPSGQIGGPYNIDTHQNLACFNPNGEGFHQGFYNFAMGVSQTDPDLVWVGCLSLSKSSDGGTNFERIGGYYTGPNSLDWIHPDCQDMVVVGDDVWLATDGGINYSSDDFTTHESRKKGIYNSTFWGFAQGWNQDIIVGGRYHNGNTGYIDTYENDVHLRLGGAEQATGYVNPILERKVYFSDISDHYLPEDLQGEKTFTANQGFYPNESYFTSENSEIAFDPRFGKHMYLGYENKLWKSVNEGLSYEMLYEFSTGSMVFEIEVCRQNPERIYASVRIGSSSRIYRSDDGGNSFSILPQDPGESQKIEIAVNPLNDDELWGIEVNSSTVFRTTDGGDSWENMTTSELFGNQFRDIQYQGGTDVVYVASNDGVYYYDSEAGIWMDMSSGLPELMGVLEMGIFYRDSKLRLCDGGKGLWETDLIGEAEAPIVQAMTLTDVISCSRDTVIFDCFSIMDHEGANWNWTFSPEPEFVSDLNIRNPKVVFGANGSFTATLTATDGNGQSGVSSVEVMVDSECDVEPFNGLALICENNGDYASTVNLNRTTDELTITAWVKPNGIQNDYTGIVMNNGTAAGINFRGGNNTLGYHWPGGAWWWDSGLVAPADQWSHVALVSQEGSVTIYLNGVGVTHEVAIEEVNINSMLIGSYQGWNGRNFNGKIDEVRIYDRVLTQEEIRELRHITLTQEQVDADENLLAYYQFNELDGDILDRSGINHAFMNGSAYRESSEGPFGGGESDRLTIVGPGFYPLENTECQINVEANDPDGEIVFSRIHFAPNELPGGLLGYENFFVVNNYGQNQFWTIEDLILKPFDFDPSDEVLSGEEEVVLFRRAENSDDPGWFELCSTTLVTEDGIRFYPDCPIDYNIQLFPVTDEFVGIDDIVSEQVLISVYPNPINKDGSFTIENKSDEKLRFTLYDAKGKLVRSIFIPAQSYERINLDSEARGLYSYSAVGDTFIRSGRVLK